VRRVPTTVVVAALVLSACGAGGALTSEEQAVASAIEAKIAQEISQDDDLLADIEPRRCFAEGIVGAFGLSRLAELGVSAAAVADSGTVFGGMTDSELRDAADVAAGCVDLGASFQVEMEAGGLSRESAACLTGRLEESDFFQQAFVAGMLGEEFTPDADGLATMVSAATECLSPEELQGFFGGG